MDNHKHNYLFQILGTILDLFGISTGNLSPTQSKRQTTTLKAFMAMAQGAYTNDVIREEGGRLPNSEKSKGRLLDFCNDKKGRGTKSFLADVLCEWPQVRRKLRWPRMGYSGPQSPFQLLMAGEQENGP